VYPVADAAAPRTVLVTGAARGIGRAIAAAFAREGDRVFAADITFPPQAAVPAITCVETDVTDPAAVDALFRMIEASTDGVDVLVNNAGILRTGDLASVTRDDWAAVMAVNLEAVYFLSQHVGNRVEPGPVPVRNFEGRRDGADAGAGPGARAGSNSRECRCPRADRYGAHANAIRVRRSFRRARPRKRAARPSRVTERRGRSRPFSCV
jgi:NAD(P)-dependent dehydrogenase (short-subunit alcohol dehydrogenase family)